MMRRKNETWTDHGFTLIELLIVVAIIAVLAAIAVPNFMEAQTRAKVSRVKADLRTQAMAEEAYFVDFNKYTKDNEAALDATQKTLAYWQKANGCLQLTTPIAYMSAILQDPFQPKDNSIGAASTQGYRIGSGTWSYDSNSTPIDEQNAIATFALHRSAPCFITFSPGPDRTRNRNSYKCFPWRPVGGNSDAKPNQPTFYMEYDPSNGTVSGGDIHCFGGSYMLGDWDHFAPGSGH